jgi:hypothetical protein
MAFKSLSAGIWKPATPKGVIQGGVWKTPTKVSVFDGTGWVQIWPDAAPEPPYLYGVDIVYLPNYEVQFTVKDGFPPDPNLDAYMFRCVEMPRDGYVGRVFNKTWAFNGYGKLNCTLEDLYQGAGKDRKTISFTITPRA